jgi:metal-responsive CopG/Arc/MetJ family transcriptional regulator
MSSRVIVGITLPQKLLLRVEENVSRLRNATSRSKVLGLLVQYHLEDQEKLRTRVMNRLIRFTTRTLRQDKSTKDDNEFVFVHAHMKQEFVDQLDVQAEALGQSRSEAARLAIEMSLDENELFIQWLVPVFVPILKACQDVKSSPDEGGEMCKQ